ncbi:hypothetical protein IFM89_032157 [Coptis chinensis]|uniref:Uncharacterized protein n=1 Tax=Coptis chinensis TaxID=261450 RepID=A0A835J387_9MAGN|nr:hypothetical protein IFM89_032157 [Coptis chinensis]
MGAVENNNASYSWLYGSHNNHNQSQWLQNTLSGDLPTKFDVVYLENAEDGLVSTEPSEMNLKKTVQNGEHERDGESKVGFDTKEIENSVCQSEDFAVDMDREKMWANLRSQVSMLMEDNLRQQAELIRRNDEKRNAIKDLCYHLEKLTDENKTLKSCCLRCSKVGKKQNQSQLSKLRELILGKILGGTSV